MAIFHHSTQVIGRSSGRSSVGAAAYRLGVELVDQRTGQAFDYTRKAGVDSWHTLAPDNAPAWVNDAGQLWNAVEAAEKRKDAQLCREVNVALPRELTPDQMKALALDYAREQWAARGMVAVVAFHDLDSANPHFHAMLTMREIGPDGFGKKNRDWNEHSLATVYREAWATRANEALERFGHASRIDHRSLIEQGITDRAPTQHQGPKASAMAARGLVPDRQRVMPVPASMDQEAARAELLRERQRQQQQQRQRQELAAGKDLLATAKNEREKFQQKATEWAATVTAEQAARDALATSIKQADGSRARRQKRHDKAASTVSQWKRAHPVISTIYTPAAVKKAAADAAKHATDRDRAQAEIDRLKPAWEKAKKSLADAITMRDLKTGQAAEAGQRVEAIRKDLDAMRKRHEWENLTPAEKQQQRQAMEEQQRAHLERVQAMKITDWRAQQKPTQTPPGQRGPRLGR